MLRFLGWLSGSVILLYLSYKFAVWHLAWQLTIVGALFLWVLFGAALLGSKVRGLKQSATDRAEIFAQARAGAERAAAVAKWGEDGAQLIERNNPQIWRRVSSPRGVAK